LIGSAPIWLEVSKGGNLKWKKGEEDGLRLLLAISDRAGMLQEILSPALAGTNREVSVRKKSESGSVRKIELSVLTKMGQ
jgi:hypothetical protein